jgi:adenosylhomocysteine nucleosidase
LKRLGVVAALEAEARAFCSSAQRHRSPGDRRSGGAFSVLDDGSLLTVSGIGFAAASAAASALTTAPVSALMTFGLAGGLDPALKPGTVVLPHQVISTSGAIFTTCRSWCARLAAEAGSMHWAVGGKLLSSALPLDSPAKKKAAFEDAGAVAVDMESAAVAAIAAAHQLPFVALRVIVDTASDPLPQSVVAASQGGRLRIGRLLAGLTPGEIAALVGLARRYRVAIGSLRAVAAAGAWAPHDSDTYLS